MKNEAPKRPSDQVTFIYPSIYLFFFKKCKIRCILDCFGKFGQPVRKISFLE